jgi:hypothetical protein
MATYAASTDVADRLGFDFDAREIRQCEALLEDVSAIMRARLPSLDADIALLKVEAGLAKAVCCRVTMLAITVVNTGVGVTSETHPEHAVTISTAAAAGLDLTDDQISQLTPPVTTGGRAFSIHPG